MDKATKLRRLLTVAFDVYEAKRKKDECPEVKSTETEWAKWKLHKEDALCLEYSGDSSKPIHFRLWRNKHKKGELYLSFRGTDNLENVVSDVIFVQDSIDSDKFPLKSDSVQPNKAVAPGELKSFYLHRGFLQAYNSVRDELMTSLLIILRNSESLYVLYVTGHSLGGALAVLAAADIACRSEFGSCDVHCDTFGAPPVGDQAFVDFFHSKVTKGCTRFQNNLDPVPRSLDLVNVALPHLKEKQKMVTKEFVHVGEACALFGEIQMARGAVSAINTAMSNPESLPETAQILNDIGMTIAAFHGLDCYIMGLELMLLPSDLPGAARQAWYMYENGSLKLRTATEEEAQKIPSAAELTKQILKTTKHAKQTSSTASNTLAAGSTGILTSPFIPVLDLAVNVVGHAATNYQLSQVRSKLDKHTKMLEQNVRQNEEIKQQVNQVDSKADALLQASHIIAFDIRNGFGEVWEKFREVHNSLDSLEKMLPRLARIVVDTNLYNYVINLRAAVETAKSEVNSAEVRNNEPKEAIKDIKRNRIVLETCINETFFAIEGNFHKESSALSFEKASPDVLHQAIVAFSCACFAASSLRMAAISKLDELSPDDGNKKSLLKWHLEDLAISVLNKREKCAELVSNWLLEFGNQIQQATAAASVAATQLQIEKRQALSQSCVELFQFTMINNSCSVLLVPELAASQGLLYAASEFQASVLIEDVTEVVTKVAVPASSSTTISEKSFHALLAYSWFVDDGATALSRILCASLNASVEITTKLDSWLASVIAVMTPEAQERGVELFIRSCTANQLDSELLPMLLGRYCPSTACTLIATAIVDVLHPGSDEYARCLSQLIEYRRADNPEARWIQSTLTALLSEFFQREPLSASIASQLFNSAMMITNFTLDGQFTFLQHCQAKARRCLTACSEANYLPASVVLAFLSQPAGDVIAAESYAAVRAIIDTEEFIEQAERSEDANFAFSVLCSLTAAPVISERNDIIHREHEKFNAIEKELDDPALSVVTVPAHVRIAQGRYWLTRYSLKQFLGTPEIDHSYKQKAVGYFQAAALMEHTDAMYLLAMVEYGEFIEQEGGAEGIELLRKAAAQGHLGALTKLMIFGNTSVKANAAVALLDMADSDENRKRIAAEGGVSPLIALLSDGDASATLKTKIAGVLAYLTCSAVALLDSVDSYWNKYLIADEGGIPPLIALLSDGDETGKANAAEVLKHLADSDRNNQKLIADAGGIPPLIALLTDGDATVKANAADALANMANGNQSNQKLIADAGGIPPLIALLTIGDARGRANASHALEALAHRDEGLRLIVDGGGIRSLIVLLSDGDENVQAHAASALQQMESYLIPVIIELLSGGNATEKANAAGALQNVFTRDIEELLIPLLIQLLSDADATAAGKANAAGALANISFHGGARRSIVAEAGIRPLIALLTDGNAMVKSNATAVLSEFIGSYHYCDERGIKLIADEGGIPPLITLLSDDDATVKANAARILVKLSVLSENRKLIAIEGGIRPLIALLTNSDTTVKANAACALAYMASRDGAKLIADDGAIPPLIKLLNDDDRTVKNNATCALMNMSLYSVPLLVALLTDGDATVKANAADALANMANGNQSNQLLIADAGGIPPLITLLTDGDATMKAHAADALANMAIGNQSNQKLIADAGGIPPLITLLSDGDATMKAHAASTLGNMALSDEFSKLIAAEGGIDLLIKLILNDDDAAVKTNAVRALGYMAARDENISKHIADAGGIRPLIALARGGSGIAKGALREMAKNADVMAQIQSAGGYQFVAFDPWTFFSS